MAALLGLGLNEGAYMAEIVRAGIISVDEGQTEAAPVAGHGRLQTLRLIVLPQAMRVIIPPTGNETISMLKNTSLVIVLGSVFELLFAAQQIYAANYQTIPLLIVASDLVPGDDQRAVRRPVLHRAPLRPRLLARRAGDDARTLAGLGRGRRWRVRMSEPMVKAEGVHKRFGRLEVLKGITSRSAAAR